MVGRTRRRWILGAGALVASTALASADSLRGWEARVGGVSGTGPASRAEVREDGGVTLSGDAATGRWTLLARPVDAPAGTWVRLRARARLVGGRLDPGQRDNAYVGLKLGEGSRHATVGTPDWAPVTLIARATAPPCETWLFLSKTGRLDVEGLALERLGPADSLDVLLDHLARTYSFLAAKSIDLDALAKRHRDAFPKDGAAAAFVPPLQALLAELKDEHVWIDVPGGKRVVPFSTSPPLNGDVKAVARRLTGLVSCGRIGFAGRLEGDVGYLAVGALRPDGAEAAQILGALDGLLDAKGLLLDLRANAGGDERLAQALVGRLTAKSVVYARRRTRNGPRPDDFGPPQDAVLEPHLGTPYAGPVVVLIGPRCKSSGEGMAQMLRALEGVTLVGLPTGGASGNPQPIELPDGVTVWSSTWIDLLLDGSLLEGHGVPPDVRVEPTGPGDPTLEEGLRLLRAKIAAR